MVSIVSNSKFSSLLPIIVYRLTANDFIGHESQFILLFLASSEIGYERKLLWINVSYAGQFMILACGWYK